MRLTIKEQDTLKKNIENAYIRVAEHPTLPLKIYNYTQKAQVESEWNNITRMCRGLVLDDKYNIIIKCPQKFFNVGEPFAADVNLLNARISEKLDGYYISIKLDPDYGLIVTSRGSFTTQYAEAAKKFITVDVLLKMIPNYTYFCELLQDFAGDEAIILTKHPIPRLVCWAIKDDKFNELPLDETCPFERARYMDYAEAKEYLNGKVEGIVAQDTKTFERVKLKTDYFLELHRIIADCTEKHVWEILKDGGKVADLDIPDEFIGQMKAWERTLLLCYADRWNHYHDLALEVSNLSDRELANADIPKHDKAMIFTIRHNKQGQKSLSTQIWKELKPSIIDSGNNE